MEYLIGLLSGVVFFAVLAISLLIGYRLGKKTPVLDIEQDEEQTRKAKQLHKEFVQVMNYNEDKARERKKVTE